MTKLARTWLAIAKSGLETMKVRPLIIQYDPEAILKEPGLAFPAS